MRTGSSDPKGGSRLMLGFHGTEVTSSFLDHLEAMGARSVILFSRNMTTAEQTRDLIADLRARAPWPLLLAVDQEGGSVVRLTHGITVFPGNMALGATRSTDLARRQGQASGSQLKDLGFDLNLAPVVDLQTNPNNPGIGIRSLGTTVEDAAPLAEALILGHAEHGVSSCLKHFPGMGEASIDAHFGRPVLEVDENSMREVHLRIFGELIGRVPSEQLAIMTTHISVPALDGQTPATFSTVMLRDILRDELAFNGLLIADDLEMGGITEHDNVSDAALRAAVADHDLIPVCHSPERQKDAAEALTRALESGKLDTSRHELAVSRIEAMIEAPRQAASISKNEGDAVALEIANHSIHCFGDSGGLLPLPESASVHLIAHEESDYLGVFESNGLDWKECLMTALRKAFDGKVTADLMDSGEDLGASMDDDSIILFCTWNIARSEATQQILKELALSHRDRLIVVHVRSPFDQAFVPDGVTALTTFGFREAQLESLVGVLRGNLACDGALPAPV